MPDPRFAVLQALAKAQKMSVDDLAKAVGLQRDELLKVLRELEKAGVIKLEGEYVLLVARVAVA